MPVIELKSGSSPFFVLTGARRAAAGLLALSRVQGKVGSASLPSYCTAAAAGDSVSRRSNPRAARAPKECRSPKPMPRPRVGGRSRGSHSDGTRSATEGRPRFFLPLAPRLSTLGCDLRRRYASPIASIAPIGRSRGLASSQTMDGSTSLRRRHRAAEPGSLYTGRWCPLCTEAL